MGGGGMMTSIRMRLVLSFSLLDFVGCSTTADADSDVADVAIVLVVISGYLLLDFPHAYHAKTSSFCSFPDKNFATDHKIEQNTRKAWYLRHFRKNATKKQKQKTLESENTETSCC